MAMFYSPDHCALCGRPTESFGEQFEPHVVRNLAIPKEAATMYLCKVCIGIIERAPNLTIEPVVQYKVQSAPPLRRQRPYGQDHFNMTNEQMQDFQNTAFNKASEQYASQFRPMTTKEMQDLLLGQFRKQHP